jgi:hypothetical protein
MITIYKYHFRIADRTIVAMPQGARILSVQIQNGVPTIWAMVVTESKMEERVLRCYGTGHEIDTFAIQGTHLATIQHLGFVWHIFE